MDCLKRSPDHPRSTGTATSPGRSSHPPAAIEPRSAPGAEEILSAI